MESGRKCITRAVLAVVILSGPLSCSVKENRAECPVYVTVLTDRFTQRGLSDGIVSFSAGQLIKREPVSFLSYLREGYEQACPRDFAQTAVLSGVENGRLSEGTLLYPTGSQADLLWAYGTSFSANSDEYVVDAVPHKQYCLVKFLFDDSPTAPEGYPWRFRLRAGYAGVDIYTLEPLPGDYCSVVGPNAVGEWYGVLPRQKDNNMKLELFIPETETGTTGRTDYVVDLGKAFEEQGYDWSAEDLADIAVRVGFTQAGVTLDIRPWDGDESYRDIEI